MNFEILAQISIATPFGTIMCPIGDVFDERDQNVF